MFKAERASEEWCWNRKEVACWRQKSR